MNGRLRTALQAAVIALVCGWAYQPCLRGGWLSDDTIEITANPDLLDLGGLARVWRGADNADYFPIKSTVQWMEWHLWHDRPAGYHWVNLGLHVLSALLLWRILGNLGLRQAWLGGLFFAIHPLAVESVAWISELKNTLSLPFLLLAMISYMNWDSRTASSPPPALAGSAPGAGRQGTRAWPWLSLFWFSIAMLCKTSVVMFPAVLLLYSWWKRGRIDRRDMVCAIPFAAISLVLGLATILFQQHRAIRGVALGSGGLLARTAAAGLSAVFYLGKTIAPVKLAFIYPRWRVNPPSPGQFLPWFAWAGLLCWLARAGRGNPRAEWARNMIFGVGWFLLNLAPVLGFIPMSYQRFSQVADHFVYLPLIGVIGTVVAGLNWGTPSKGCRLSIAGRGPPTMDKRTTPGDLEPRWFLVEVHWPVIVALRWAAIAALCLSLAWQSRRCAAGFADETALWTSTLRQNPNAGAAHNNLGLALASAGRWQDAIAQHEEALRLDPSYPEARNNLGSVLLRTGHPAEAIPNFEAALRLDSTFAEAHNNLGDALQTQGRFAEAIVEYREALRLKPSYPDADYNLGLCLFSLRRLPEAIAAYLEAIRLNPDFSRARNNLGVALARSGRFEEAIAQYRRALHQDPNYPEAENNLGLALAKSGRLQESMSHFEAAVRLKPDYAEARHNLEVARDRNRQEVGRARRARRL